MRLKVSSSNFYVGNTQPVEDAKFLASLNCDLSGIQEGHGGNGEDIKRTLRKTHTTFWGRTKNSDINFAMLDVPIVINNRVQIIKTWARKVSNRAQVKNIGMPRAATAARIEKGGYNVTFINTHLNAAVQNRKTRGPLPTRIKRVAEYVKSMVILEAMIRRAKSRGDLVVITGDLNFSIQKKGVWKFSPQAMFERTGLNYKNQHLDYIAYSKEFKPNSFTVIPTTQTGSDHPWLTIELRTT